MAARPLPLKSIDMIRKFTLCALCCALLFSLSFVSCKKFKGSQTVPAYIRIDGMDVDCDYGTYRANTSNISDAWVYVDDQIIGCYELPATFPVLEKGKHKVSVYGGICMDGRGAARGPYSFYAPKVFEDVELFEDSIVMLNGDSIITLNYYPINEGVVLHWQEDFENGNGLTPTQQSDTGLFRISGSEAWRSVNSFNSGKVVLPPDSLDFTVAIGELTCHTNLLGEKPLFLEMDYKTNDTIFVGIIYQENYTVVQWPMVKVLPTDTENDVPQKWKKIYINLGTLMHEHESADYFKVYFTSDLTVHSDYGQPDYVHPHKWRYYYFDNLKVLYRQ